MENLLHSLPPLPFLHQSDEFDEKPELAQLLKACCCFFKLAAIADLMGCNGLLSALLEGGWADAAHGPPNTSHHFSPGIYELRVLL
jgi:hypothetical protein